MLLILSEPLVTASQISTWITSICMPKFWQKSQLLQGNKALSWNQHCPWHINKLGSSMNNLNFSKRERIRCHMAYLLTFHPKSSFQPLGICTFYCDHLKMFPFERQLFFISLIATEISAKISPQRVLPCPPVSQLCSPSSLLLNLFIFLKWWNLRICSCT